jgi:hypothetical protein
MNKEQYTNYAGSVYAGIVKLNTEGNNTLASEYGVAFFEAMGASLAGHSQMARNLLDKLADKLDFNH